MEPTDNSPFLGWSLQSPNRVRDVKTTSNGRGNFTVEILRLRNILKIFGGSAQPVGPTLTMLLQRDREVGHH